MIEVRQTDNFKAWLKGLRHSRAPARIRRLADGNAGDVKPVGEGISELRIHQGPGYRAYFERVGNAVVVLLCGGDKSTQDADIVDAKAMAMSLEEH